MKIFILSIYLYTQLYTCSYILFIAYQSEGVPSANRLIYSWARWVRGSWFEICSLLFVVCCLLSVVCLFLGRSSATHPGDPPSNPPWQPPGDPTGNNPATNLATPLATLQAAHPATHLVTHPATYPATHPATPRPRCYRHLVGVRYLYINGPPLAG